MDGEYLHGWERNVVISLVVPQTDGSVNLYFDHATNDPADPRYWEVEVYQTGISQADFIAESDLSGQAQHSLIRLWPILSMIRSVALCQGKVY